MPSRTRTALAAVLASALTLGGTATVTTILSAPPAMAKSDKAKGGGKGGQGGSRIKMNGGKELSKRQGGGNTRGGGKAPAWLDRSAKKAGTALDDTFSRLTGQKPKTNRGTARHTTTETALAPSTSMAPKGKPDRSALKGLNALNASDQAFLNASDNSRIGRIRTFAAAYYAEADAGQNVEQTRLALEAMDLLAADPTLEGADGVMIDRTYDDVLADLMPDATDEERAAVLAEIEAAGDRDTLAASLESKENGLIELSDETQRLLEIAAGPNAAPTGDDLAWVIDNLPPPEVVGYAPDADTPDAPVETADGTTDTTILLPGDDEVIRIEN